MKHKNWMVSENPPNYVPAENGESLTVFRRFVRNRGIFTDHPIFVLHIRIYHLKRDLSFSKSRQTISKFVLCLWPMMLCSGSRRRNPSNKAERSDSSDSSFTRYFSTEINRKLYNKRIPYWHKYFPNDL